MSVSNLMLFEGDPQTFDLEQLATQINRRHALATDSAKSAIEHAREAGRLLAIAKDKAGHGNWSHWLQVTFKGSAKTASNYMRLAREWPSIEADSNPQRVADLSLRRALQLVAKARPAPCNTTSEHLADASVRDCQDADEHKIEVTANHEERQAGGNGTESLHPLVDEDSDCTTCIEPRVALRNQRPTRREPGEWAEVGPILDAIDAAQGAIGGVHKLIQSSGGFVGNASNSAPAKTAYCDTS